MKRRYFLRKIGWVVPVVVTAPIIASELVKDEAVVIKPITKIPVIGDGWISQIENSNRNIVVYPLRELEWKSLMNNYSLHK